MSHATYAPTPTSGNDDTKEPRAQMLKQLAQPACDISREQWDVGFEGLLWRSARSTTLRLAGGPLVPTEAELRRSSRDR